ncbi:MAG: alpha amylase [Lachnospiraceae bacterium]|nr:alpha amylase [Lachnospiraceae bacterium]
MKDSRIIKFICLTVATCLLTACGYSTSGPAVSEPAESDPVESESASAELLPPNIIDDNYRNYYEIFVGSFCDSDDDGIGDLRGIESKLDYISDLGCNGIWLTPVMAAPSYHKYDTTDYYMIDPAFGTNEDFKSLADACHERGIRLIIDLVINHSSNEHPWFKEACDYLRTLPEGGEPDPGVCPTVDYYHFSREKLNASYSEVSGSDWYYEAVFYYTQPDLNLHNEAVVDELEKVAAYWIGLGCDGFRMDAAMHYDDEVSSYNTDFLHDYYEYCRTLDPDFYMVSEVWASEKTIADYYASGTPSFFNFDAADAEGKLIRAGRGKLTAEKFVEACADYEKTYGAANPDFIDAPFITNHDMGRVANALQSKPADMKMTAGLLLSMSGSPFIYYGEEIGLKSKGNADENKRLHMNWDGTVYTGAGADSGVCRDPQGADTDIEQSFPSVEDQERDPDSILSYYKKALAIRNAYPEIARGRIGIIDELTDGHIAVMTKTWNDEKIAIVYNTGEESATVDISGEGTGVKGMKPVAVLYANEENAGEGDTDSDPKLSESVVAQPEILEIPPKTIVYLK